MTHPGLSKTGENCRKQGNLKQLALIAYGNRGVLSIDFVPVWETVNGTFYADFEDEIETRYTQKRLALLNAGVVIIHDNATPHKSVALPGVIGNRE